MIDLSNENIVHVKNGDLQYLQFRKLLKYDDILKHAYTLKKFDAGNNCSLLNKKDEILKDYRNLCNVLKLNYNKIVRPKQMHTDNVTCIKNDISHISIWEKEYENVDGLITNKNGIILSLTYADCVPILLFDPVEKVIANIHSGWRGTVKKIAKKAVEKMVNEYGCKLKNIIACIGPCIGKCHFEVGEEVCNMFKNSFDNTRKIIEKGAKLEEQKYNIDVALANSLILSEIGLKPENIIQSNICTVCNSNLIHSYRIEKSQFGTNTAIMSLL